MSVLATVGAVGDALTVVVDHTATDGSLALAAPTALASASASIVVEAVDGDSPTFTLSPDDYRHLNFTGMRADHWSHHKGYDSTTPRNMMIALAGVLLLCMLVQHTRFLARLFASLPERGSESKSNGGPRLRDDQSFPPVSAIPNSATFLTDRSQQRAFRRVAGGGLFSGWILRKGQTPTGLTSPSLDSKEGFESPYSRPSPSRSVSVDSISQVPLCPSGPQYLPPPHVKPALNHLPFSRWLHVAPFSWLPEPFGSTVKVPQLYVIAAYLIVCIVALFWKSNPLPPTPKHPYGNDFQRSGLIAMTQIPLVIALGVRGNVIGLCVGKGYERLKTFHKIVGRVCFIASTIHTAFWVAKWIWMGKVMAFSRKPFVLYGWIAWAALVLIVVSSLPWVRKRWFALFEVCHTIGIILFLAGTALHVKVAEPWCVAAGVIYLISMVFTLTKTKIVRAEILALPSSASTVVTIPALRDGWRAGQHVRIRVPALGMRLGFEGHPFTISSAPGGEGMILMCKNTGDWTNALHKLAQGSHRQTERGLGIATPTDVTMIVEGPHGGLGNTLLPSFSSVLLCAGGSGITHSLSLAHDLLTKASTGVVRARTVDLVWIIRTDDIAQPLMPTLLDMVNDAKAFEINCLNDRKYGGNSPRPVALRVQIYVTRCPSSSPLSLESICPPMATAMVRGFDTIDINHLTYDQNRSPFGDNNPFDDENDETKGGATSGAAQYVNRKPSSAKSSGGFSGFTCQSARAMPLSSISAYPKRADFNDIVASLVEETVTRHAMERTDASGVCVTACGPEAMVESVNVAVRNVNADRRRAVGGLDFEEECFGY